MKKKLRYIKEFLEWEKNIHSQTDNFYDDRDTLVKYNQQNGYAEEGQWAETEMGVVKIIDISDDGNFRGHTQDGEEVSGKTSDIIRTMAPEELRESKNNKFMNWFGDSKVVDANNNPLVVYHGSNSHDIEAFNKYNNISQCIYFSDSLDNAQDYGENIYKVYLKITNPVILDAEHKYFEHYFDVMDSEIKWAKKNGNDGVIIHNLKDSRDGTAPIDYQNGGYLDYDSSTVYVVFEPEQIKSIDNKGKFNPKSDNIYEWVDFKSLKSKSAYNETGHLDVGFHNLMFDKKSNQYKQIDII